MALALQLFRSSDSPQGTGPKVVLNPIPRALTPGETITVTGRYSGRTLAGVSGAGPQLCWDGCQRGLTESPNSFKRLGGDRFSVRFIVPDAPWLEGTKAAPLISGDYQLGINCLAVKTGGCVGWPAQGTTTVHLDVAHPVTCAKGCFRLRVTPARARPGQVVHVTGFAPLISLLGRSSFGPSIEDFPSTTAANVARNRYSKTPSEAILRGATTVTVLAAPSWSTLPRINPVSIESGDGIGALSVDPNDSSRIAYCGDGKIHLSSNGGTSWSTLPVAHAASVITSDHLQTPNGGTTPGCSSVTLSGRGVIFASFIAVPLNQDSIPPEYLAAMYTTNNGVTWHAVPTPVHASPPSFVGFSVQGDIVEAKFLRGLNAYNDQSLLEVTRDEGATWTSSSGMCPVSGPCVQIEPSYLTNCMGQEQDPLEYSLNHGASWQEPVYEPQVSPCAFSEVVEINSTSALLLNLQSPYPLEMTTDSGKTWQDYSLPSLPTDDQGGYGAGIEMLPNGSLLEFVNAWKLLAPGASKWCTPAINAKTESSVGFYSSPPIVDGNRVLWLRTGNTTAYESAPLSELACA
jgi:hypothetical protein